MESYLYWLAFPCFFAWFACTCLMSIILSTLPHRAWAVRLFWAAIAWALAGVWFNLGLFYWRAAACAAEAFGGWRG